MNDFDTILAADPRFQIEMGDAYEPAPPDLPGDPRPELPEHPPDKTEADPLTDLGNGRRFAADHREMVRFCHPWKKWLIWDRTRWRLDDAGRATELAKATIMRMFHAAKQAIAAMTDDDSPEAKAQVVKIKKLLDHAMKSQHVNRIKAMLDLAKSEEGIPIAPDALDVDPMVMNLVNGTLDLRTGRLRPHDQSDYLTKLATVAFDPSAKCPRWEKFVSEVFDHKASLVGYLQRTVGYWMTGLVTEHVVPVWFGSGANGKSTAISVTFKLFGEDYAGKAARDLLTAVKGDKHPTALASLHGKRFMAAIETEEGARIDEVLVKELTGGDTVTARRMKEDYWSFQPTHKLAIITNHKPSIRGSDHAIWRRLRLVPFTVCFAEDKQDKKLGDKLKAELPGIMNWALAGCLEWQRGGLADPPEVLAATADYRTAEDRLGEFITERCQINTEFRVKITALYNSFKQWAVANGERELSSTAFGRAISERGYERDAGRRWYLGLDLIPSE